MVGHAPPQRQALVRHPAFPDALSRPELVAWYRRSRNRTRLLFEIPIEDAWYDRPIALRNPIVFYEGHLPAFSVNTLVKLARKAKGIDPHFETLFERGIDPEDETAVRDPAAAWPSRRVVHDYGREADALVERALLELEDDPVQIEAAAAIVEHELMHQETLLYMFHNMDFGRKRRKERSGADEDTRAPEGVLDRSPVRIPAGNATLGAQAEVFAWDNERPQHVVRVASFEIDRFPVTNAGFLEFMAATGSAAPHFWRRIDQRWFWRGMFELIPLPLDWPAWVTHEQAQAYALWRGGRLPSEAEYHRAAFGTPDGQERPLPWGEEPADSSRGNFDFHSWDPQPVGARPGGASAWGVHDLAGNGWEWTSTPFDGFPGFRPMTTYRLYSIDFFDGAHYVMKGGSPATARELIRASFRNWFRPNYPYVFAKFRCAY